MPFKDNKVILLAVLVISLSVISVSSYTLFSLYKPEVEEPKEQVKGSQTQNVQPEVPLPSTFKEIRWDVHGQGIQRTFETEDSAEKVQAFYKNYLQENDWEIKEENQSDNTLITKYQKDQKYLLITTTTNQEMEETLVSIDIIPIL